MSANVSQKIFSLIDLTSLNDADTEETITALCEKAVSTLGHVAAVCVYSQFVPQAKQLLANTSVKIATVANFPSGEDPLENVLLSIKQSMDAGADEIDVVLPYQAYLRGDEAFAIDFIKECKTICNDKLLKVILETGAFGNPEIIFQVSKDCLLAGADFIKTSTGKISIGATLPAAKAMLSAIQELTPKVDRVLGFKVSGGIRTLEKALQYYQLAADMMGERWISPETFRIGASQLVDELTQ